MTGEEKYQQAVTKVLGSLQGTQAQIAEAIGVSQQYVHKLKTGKTTPSPDVLDRMAKLAGMELTIAVEKKTRKNARNTTIGS